jgi:hypothetical protein
MRGCAWRAVFCFDNIVLERDTRELYRLQVKNNKRAYVREEERPTLSYMKDCTEMPWYGCTGET